MSQTTATPEIYTLSLHDALPISSCCPSRSTRRTTRNSRTARIAIRDAEPGSFRTVLGADDDHSARGDRKSTRLNSSHVEISYAVFCLKKKTSIELWHAVHSL